MKVNSIEYIINQLQDKDINGDIMEHIVSSAFEYFEHCQNDFCLQHASFEYIIFGSYNRLKWDINNGFNPITSNCSKKFLEHAKTII